MTDRSEELMEKGSIKTFVYSYNGHKFVGQGLNESYIRNAIETKNGLETGTLSPGKKGTSFKNIKSRLRLPEHIIVSGNTTVGELMNHSTLDSKNTVLSVICQELLVPSSEARFITDSTTMSFLWSEFFFKRIEVKLHKVVKRTVQEGKVRKNLVVDVICRVEDTIRMVEMLHKEDYRLIVELANYEEELDKMQASLRKSESALSQHIPDTEKTKHRLNIEKLSPLIDKYSESLRKLETTSSNTGFLLSMTDEYEVSDYPSWKKLFYDAYIKLRKRILFMYISEVEYKNGITLLEYIDSYWLLEDEENNKYANTL